MHSVYNVSLPLSTGLGLSATTVSHPNIHDGLALDLADLHHAINVHAASLSLDDALQLPIHDTLTNVTVGRWPLNVPAGEMITWGNNYGYSVTEADPAIGEEIKTLLPKTMKRKA